MAGIGAQAVEQGRDANAVERLQGVDSDVRPVMRRAPPDRPPLRTNLDIDVRCPMTYLHAGEDARARQILSTRPSRFEDDRVHELTRSRQVVEILELRVQASARPGVDRLRRRSRDQARFGARPVRRLGEAVLDLELGPEQHLRTLDQVLDEVCSRHERGEGSRLKVLSEMREGVRVY